MLLYGELPHLAIVTGLIDRPALAMALNLLGHLAAMQGEPGTASVLYAESLLLARADGDRRRLGYAAWTAATPTWLAETPGADQTDESRPEGTEQGARLSSRGRCGNRAPPGALLTRREREVAVLIAQGLSNQQLAERLVISERTVANHVHSILGKLGRQSRVQIAAWAFETGLMPLK
jgi:non-specific serine/threonine protein kinase